MRVHVGKTDLLIAALIFLVIFTLVLSYLSRTLSPDQIDDLLTYLPGQTTRQEFDHTVKLSNGFRLSTKSNSAQFVLLAKRVKRLKLTFLP